jgi:hypothetical protein
VAERDTDERDLRGEGAFEVANEFAGVRVRKVHTRNGERLEIASPRQGTLVRLDALELEALSGQEPELFTRLLSEPGAHEGELT